jgi:hypothetical protein
MASSSPDVKPWLEPLRTLSMGRARSDRVIVRWDAEGCEGDLAFMRDEAMVVAEFRHPAIARVLSVVERDGLLVVEYEVRSAAEPMRWETPWPEVVRVFADVADGLYLALHAVGHVRAGPLNWRTILTDEHGGQLVAFPFLGVASQWESVTLRCPSGLARVDVVAPEQLNARPESDRTHTFFLAHALYELLAGRRPFGTRREDAFGYLTDLRDGRVLPLPRELPSVLSTVIVRALGCVPDERPGLDFFGRVLRDVHSSCAPTPRPGEPR